MKKNEKRDVEVKYCDLCGEETNFLSQCAICKRDMCNKDGGAAHTAFSIELYRYGDGKRLNSNICKECAARDIAGLSKFTIHEFLDGMMGKDPASMPKK